MPYTLKVVVRLLTLRSQLSLTSQLLRMTAHSGYKTLLRRLLLVVVLNLLTTPRPQSALCLMHTLYQKFSKLTMDPTPQTTPPQLQSNPVVGFPHPVQTMDPRFTTLRSSGNRYWSHVKRRRADLPRNQGRNCCCDFSAQTTTSCRNASRNCQISVVSENTNGDSRS